MSALLLNSVLVQLAFCTLFFGILAFTVSSQDIYDAEDTGLEIDGLIVDETRTRMGSEFYDLFYTYWSPPPQARNFTIVIQEQPVPQMGTRITLKVNDQETAQFMLHPRYDIIDEYARQSVQFLQHHLEERAMMQLQLQREGQEF